MMFDDWVLDGNKNKYYEWDDEGGVEDETVTTRVLKLIPTSIIK